MTRIPEISPEFLCSISVRHVPFLFSPSWNSVCGVQHRRIQLPFSLVPICEPSFSATLEFTSRQVKSRQETMDRRSRFSPVVVATWRQRRNRRGRDENEAWKPCPACSTTPEWKVKAEALQMAIERDEANITGVSSRQKWFERARRKFSWGRWGVSLVSAKCRS